jgi:hypothetical protein
MNCNKYNAIFENRILEYHKTDHIDQMFISNYDLNTLDYLLDKKNHIDTVQWHLEDIIREPSINPETALSIKRRIDKSNQDRTDLVELIDDWFFDHYKNITVQPDAFIATETPAWAIDRLSILNLKIWHMREETLRKDASEEHVQKCTSKLDILFKQRIDLSTAINQLFDNIKSGKVIIKTYKQMKMYNDPNLNPVLRKS